MIIKITLMADMWTRIINLHWKSGTPVYISLLNKKYVLASYLQSGHELLVACERHVGDPCYMQSACLHLVMLNDRERTEYLFSKPMQTATNETGSMSQTQWYLLKVVWITYLFSADAALSPGCSLWFSY